MVLSSKVTPPTLPMGPGLCFSSGTYGPVSYSYLVPSLAPFSICSSLSSPGGSWTGSITSSWLGLSTEMVDSCPLSPDPLQVPARAGIALGSPLVLPCGAAPLLLLPDDLTALHDLDLHYCKGKCLSALSLLRSECRKAQGREWKGLKQLETCCLTPCPCKIAEGPIDIALGLFSTFLLRPQGVHSRKVV